MRRSLVLFVAAVSLILGIATPAHAATVPTTYCNGRSYQSIVKKYYRGPAVIPLRCGNSGWGFIHLVAGHEWNAAIDANIQAAFWGGVPAGYGILDLYPPSCVGPVFRVVYNPGALNGNGVSPQGVITAYYRTATVAPPLAEPACQPI